MLAEGLCYRSKINLSLTTGIKKNETGVYSL